MKGKTYKDPYSLSHEYKWDNDRDSLFNVTTGRYVEWIPSSEYELNKSIETGILQVPRENHRNLENNNTVYEKAVNDHGQILAIATTECDTFLHASWPDSPETAEDYWV